MSSISVTSYLGNLVKFLPTGTVFVYQTLNSAATNSGHCDAAVNKYLSSFLFGICLFVCFLATFTDSYTDEKGERQYVVVTPWGLVPTPPSEYASSISGFGVGDVFHAVVAAIVFAVLGLMDTNTVLCFYPEYESTKRTLLQLLPPVVLAIPCVACTCFPYNRHGLGYPPASTTPTPPPSNLELSKNNNTTPSPPPPPPPTSTTPPPPPTSTTTTTPPPPPTSTTTTPPPPPTSTTTTPPPPPTSTTTTPPPPPTTPPPTSTTPPV